MELVLLEKSICARHPTLKSQCCGILNHEWPRSAALRRRALDTSASGPGVGGIPAVLALVQWFEGEPAVLATGRIAPVPADPDAVWIESVVSAGDAGRVAESVLIPHLRLPLSLSLTR